jgi:hypothetical protein
VSERRSSGNAAVSVVEIDGQPGNRQNPRMGYCEIMWLKRDISLRSISSKKNKNDNACSVLFQVFTGTKKTHAVDFIAGSAAICT